AYEGRDDDGIAGKQLVPAGDQLLGHRGVVRAEWCVERDAVLRGGLLRRALRDLCEGQALPERVEREDEEPETAVEHREVNYWNKAGPRAVCHVRAESSGDAAETMNLAGTQRSRSVFKLGALLFAGAVSFAPVVRGKD